MVVHIFIAYLDKFTERRIIFPGRVQFISVCQKRGSVDDEKRDCSTGYIGYGTF